MFTPRLSSLGSPISPVTVSAIADAIDRMEGPGITRNNPGNLRTWGDLPTQGGFAVFPTPGEGRAALERQVALNISRGLTLEEFFCGKAGVYPGYAPDADRNNCRGYAGNVSTWTGVPLGVPIETVYDLGTMFSVDATGSLLGDGGAMTGLIIAAAALLLLSAQSQAG